MNICAIFFRKGPLWAVNFKVLTGFDVIWIVALESPIGCLAGWKQIWKMGGWLHTLHSILYTVRSTLCTPHSHSILYTSHSTLDTWHLALHTLHSTRYTLHFRLWTLHCILHIPHFTLHTPQSQGHTLHIPTHYIPHSTLHSLHWQGNRAHVQDGWNNLIHKHVLRDCIRVRWFLLFSDSTPHMLHGAGILTNIYPINGPVM